MALRIVRSFRATATNASFPGFPAARSRSYTIFRVSLNREPISADMVERISIQPLRTPRIDLQIPSPAHVEGIFSSFAADPEVTKFLAWPPAQTLEESATAMARRLRRLESGEELSWILVLRETDDVMGSLSLWPRADGTEIGFALARSCWGRGLAVEAAGAAIRWAREELRPGRIWGSCDPDNLRSARVLEKLGFVEVEFQPASRVRPNLSSEPRGSRVFEIVMDAASRESVVSSMPRRFRLR